MQFAAEPDVVAEIKGIAGRLRDVPRDWLAHPYDMVNALQREGSRLDKLADRIETIAPIAKKPGAPARLARITTKPARALKRGVEGQMSLAL